MNERPAARSSTASQGDGDELGIPWEAGEEDYPFAALPGEAALEYFQRWLDDAGYARIERGGARYLHETDVTNVVNHITADVSLLRAGWTSSATESSRQPIMLPRWRGSSERSPSCTMPSPSSAMAISRSADAAR